MSRPATPVRVLLGVNAPLGPWPRISAALTLTGDRLGTQGLRSCQLQAPIASPDAPRVLVGGDLHLLRHPRGVLGKILNNPWLSRPGGGLCESLVVADVDLDTGESAALPPITAPHSEPEGVHGLVWLHGEPIGQITVLGSPSRVLKTLAAVAERELEDRIRRHVVRDALAGAPVADTLRAIPHPRDRAPDGSLVTVAVCTRDRPEDLRRCLTAIAALRTDVAEVLVIDNASADARARQVAESFPGFRCVREPRRGLNWARNRALLEARGSIVAFTDDDVLVHPGWVEGILRAFEDEPEAAAVTGLVVPAELATPAQILAESQGGFGRGFRRRWISVAVRHGEVAARRWPDIAGAGVGANMAFRREAALGVGGFDPALDVGTPTGGGGDHEMLFRLAAAGHSLVYEPSAVVRHKHRITMAELARQRRADGSSQYSVYLGAAAHYGFRHRAAFLWYAFGAAVRQQALALLATAARPRMRPFFLRRAVARGIVEAIVRRLYRRSLTQASIEAAEHPDEPMPPPLLRVAAGRRILHARGETVVRVDLEAGPITAPTAVASRRLRLEVVRGHAAVTTLVIRADGARVSAPRLRWELADGLEAAALPASPTGSLRLPAPAGPPQTGRGAR